LSPFSDHGHGLFVQVVGLLIQVLNTYLDHYPKTISRQKEKTKIEQLTKKLIKEREKLLKDINGSNTEAIEKLLSELENLDDFHTLISPTKELISKVKRSIANDKLRPMASRTQGRINPTKSPATKSTKAASSPPKHSSQKQAIPKEKAAPLKQASSKARTPATKKSARVKVSR
jgi:hypothetical protein